LGQPRPRPRGRPLAASPEIAGCEVFPADNPWNQRVDKLPVAGDSEQILAQIGLDVPVHADFGTVYDGAPNGIPITVVLVACDGFRSISNTRRSPTAVITRYLAGWRSRAGRGRRATGM
jgi:hypothetical protein